MAALRPPKRPAPAALLAAAFFSSLLLAAPAAALPPPEEPWLHVQSRNFTVYSNAGEKNTRRIVVSLERLRAALAQLIPDLALSSPQPTYIYVFRNDDSFEPYKLLYKGRPLKGRGYFVSHPEANYVAVNGDPKGDETAVIYHEYLHYLIRNNYPDLPLWLNEGLAEYYSTFTASGTEGWIGLPVREHVLWLRRKPMLPLRELFAVDEGSTDYNEGDRRGVFYAQSWALVHYLLAGDPERRERTAGYLRTVASGKAGPDALRQLLGDEELLERQLRAYIRRPVVGYVTEPLQAESDFPLEMKPLAYPDALARLGELLLRASDGQRTAETGEHFRAVLARHPDHPRALAGLGRVEELSGRRDEAHALYEKAARLAPDDFTIHYRLAVNLLEPDTDGSRLPRAHAALEQVVRLRPDYAEAWGRLAQVLTLMDPLPPEAIQVLETAHDLLPARTDLSFNLTLAYAQAGERAKAEELIERVLVPRAPDMVERARDAVLLGERKQVEKLIGQGRLQDAVPQLETLIARAHSDRRREELQRRLDEVRYVLNYNQFGDRYNRAVEYIGAGNRKAAEELLQELVSTTLDAGQRQEAEELLAKVRSGDKGGKR